MNIIRKIIIGQNPKDAMAYVIDMKAGNGTIAAIEFDERLYETKGDKCYKIYISTSSGTVLWKRVWNMPVIEENDCHFE